LSPRTQLSLVQCGNGLQRNTQRHILCTLTFIFFANKISVQKAITCITSFSLVVLSQCYKNGMTNENLHHFSLDPKIIIATFPEKLCAIRFRHYESDLYDVFMFSRTNRLLVLIQFAKRQCVK